MENGSPQQGRGDRSAVSPSAEFTRAETINFIEAMLGQLNKLAEQQQLPMLSYLIEMAWIEAGDLVREDVARPNGEERSSRA